MFMPQKDSKKLQYIRLLRKLFLDGKICLELLEALIVCEDESLN